MNESEKQSPIIVVDDDAAMRKLLQRHLELAGYCVTAFEDARTALESIRALRGGMVVADWSMPEMDGLQLLQAVREMEEEHILGNVYFILLTAHNTKEEVITGLEAGANDYLIKPYHKGELMARVGVGQRVLGLQDDILRHSLQLQKANAQMAVLARELEHLANTDVLTQLPNRRSLFEQLEKSWALAEKEGRPLSCILLDIDRFKKINDTHGHAAGDTVLKAVAALIRRHARRPEWCGRLGGEEFVLFFPGLGLAETLDAAEQLRLDVAEHLVSAGETTVAVTISAGVAEKSADAPCADAVIRNADAVMYLAKQNGRNQTWVYGGDGQAHAVRAGIVATVPGAEIVVPAAPVSRGWDRPSANRVESGHAHTGHE